MDEELTAIRATVVGHVQGVFFRDTTVARARELGVLGWVRNGEDGETVHVHAEGPDGAVDRFISFLNEGPPRAEVRGLDLEYVPVEGHEQFAIRGVPAGAFAVRETDDGGYELALEVDGGRRRWALRKPPSTEPSEKRLALPLTPDAPAATGPTWDAGPYEQGGRVPWPAALERGHAVFVLHGERLTGGFALQRTADDRWLLVKRRER